MVAKLRLPVLLDFFIICIGVSRAGSTTFPTSALCLEAMMLLRTRAARASEGGPILGDRCGNAPGRPPVWRRS